MLDYWVYISKAREMPSPLDDTVIYLQSRNRNPGQGITGYLHREKQHYLQYVEGPWDAIARLRRKIGHDPRHDVIVTVERGRIDARRFPDWDMAFTDDTVVSFAAFQEAHGGETRITRAHASDIMAFLDFSGGSDRTERIGMDP